MRNQYFQLEFRETDAYIHIYPPVDGGAQLKIAEVTEYLTSKKYDKYDLKLLNAALNNLEADSIVPIGDWDMLLYKGKPRYVYRAESTVRIRIG